MSHSLPLLPFTELDITKPNIHEKKEDFIHDLKQHDKRLNRKQYSECCAIEKRMDFQNYFVRYLVWGNGNWSCVYDRFNWHLRIIQPGQIEAAYHACKVLNDHPKQKPKHWYHLNVGAFIDLTIIDEASTDR
ncbi:hypothetical protein [Cellvibrio fibrivorans]|uniref:Uncharacterized protein n=1 Tax=Cellvibrio fibrivorans TaxID=126350 RepID=A0ABU1V3T3_9GAMM|nr:hypothetical protein [Cellvibrio fibrivorans]MDR7092100.1 hypothetical protein [Cellvibrio fibrivorans]